MKTLDLRNHEYAEEHRCESYRDGDWIVFTCPLCLDYERRLNWRTGNMTAKDQTPIHIQHSGEYFPTEYDHAFTCAN